MSLPTQNERGPARLYAYRSVSHETSTKLMAWAHSQGILSTLDSWDMHITLIYSSTPTAWEWNSGDRESLLIKGGKRSIELFGEDKDTLVLKIESSALSDRHAELLATGCTSDYPDYQPHITITYKGKGVDVSQIAPYTGDIQLDREWFKEAGDNPYGKQVHMTNHASQNNGYQSYSDATVVKVNAKLGLVFGYAVVCKVEGEDFYDHHQDHIPEESMLKAAVGFMKSDRVSGDMHARDADDQPVQDGNVVFAFPMTQEIADSLGIVVKQTGLLVAMQPSPSVLKKFESGEYTGFSIGGRRIVDKDAD
jgi:hypothetical protein